MYLLAVLFAYVFILLNYLKKLIGQRRRRKKLLREIKRSEISSSKTACNVIKSFAMKFGRICWERESKRERMRMLKNDEYYTETYIVCRLMEYGHRIS